MNVKSVGKLLLRVHTSSGIREFTLVRSPMVVTSVVNSSGILLDLSGTRGFILVRGLMSVISVVKLLGIVPV